MNGRRIGRSELNELWSTPFTHQHMNYMSPLSAFTILIWLRCMRLWFRENAWVLVGLPDWLLVSGKILPSSIFVSTQMMIFCDLAGTQMLVQVSVYNQLLWMLSWYNDLVFVTHFERQAELLLLKMQCACMKWTRKIKGFMKILKLIITQHFFWPTVDRKHGKKVRLNSISL